jgi:hypothetical protein
MPACAAGAAEQGEQEVMNQEEENRLQAEELRNALLREQVDEQRRWALVGFLLAGVSGALVGFILAMVVL